MHLGPSRGLLNDSPDQRCLGRADCDPDPAGLVPREEPADVLHPMEARAQGLATAAARIREMAIGSQVEALQSIRQQDASALEEVVVWSLKTMAESPSSAAGPGAQPFLVVCKVRPHIGVQL
jgi:hypothetical protein